MGNILIDILKIKTDYKIKLGIIKEVISLLYILLFGPITVFLFIILALILLNDPNFGLLVRQKENFYTVVIILILALIPIFALSRYATAPKWAIFWEEVGDIYAQRGIYANARDAYKESLKINPVRAYSWHRLGDISVKQGSQENAIEEYKKAVEIDPQLAACWEGLGDIYFLRSGYNDALAAYQKSLDLSSQYDVRVKLSICWEKLGDLYFEQGLVEESIEVYKKGTEANSNSASLWEKLGDIYSHHDNPELAVEAYSRLFNIDHKPRNEAKLVSSLLYLGDLYVQKRLFEKAIDAYRKVLKLDPTKTYLWLKIAEILSKEGNYDGAIKAYKKILEIDPKSASTWLGLGNVYAQQGKYKDAINAYSKVLEIDPKSASAWLGLGNIYAQKGDYIDAANAYKNAIEIDPSLASSWLGLANILAQQGDYEEATKAYKKALEIDPMLASSWLGLGNIYAQQGNFEDAINAYNKALEIDPELASSWLGLGNVLIQQGKYEEAIGAYSKINEDNIEKRQQIKINMDSAELKKTLKKALFDTLDIQTIDNNIVILFDISESMLGQKIRDAKEVITKFLESDELKGNSIGLITFGEKVETYSFGKFNDSLTRSLINIEPKGSTPLYAALLGARHLMSDKVNRILVIITDGMPNDALPDAIVNYSGSLKDLGYRIICIGIGSGSKIDKKFLKKIASSAEDFHHADVDLDFKTVKERYELKYDYSYKAENINSLIEPDI